MPLYEYQCRDCKTKFEELIGKTVPDHFPACPKCGSTDCERLFSTFATAGKSVATPSCPHSDSCAKKGFT